MISKRGYTLSVNRDASPATLTLHDPTGACVARVTAPVAEGATMTVKTFVELPFSLLESVMRHARQQLAPVSDAFTVMHELVLLDRRSHDAFAQGFPHRHPEALRISDTVMEQLWESLTWVPTWLVRAQDEPTHGVDLCGITEIRHDGAPQLAAIARAWASLWSRGPEPLVLRNGSNLVWSDDGSEAGRWYLEDTSSASVTLRRDESVAALHALAELAERLLTLDSNHYIIHGGI